MRLLKLSLFASALLLGSMTMKAQSADEVMNKHIAAVGGAESWKKITSIKRSGTVSLQGNECKLTMCQAQKKGFRMDLDFDMGGTVVNNYVLLTNTEGWQYFPVGGQTEPQAMTPDQVKESQDELDLTDDVVKLKTAGTKVTYDGKEQVEGKECHKLSYVNKDGDPVTLHFDAASGYLVKKTEKMEVQPGQKMDVTSSFSNYQKLPEGISVPMSGNDPNLGAFTFTSVDINKGVDDNTFKRK
ncbi:MAG TPA: hypothetical protein VEB40_01470 [Flavipsychrobacter sp.]|nr:hypothetical protein [Flavipsychrobacter sp.]